MGTNIHYSMNIQHQFSDHDVFEIGYVGNRGVHLSATNDANVPLTAGPGAIQLRRPYPLWSGISYQTQDMTNRYNSLQAKFEHRFSHGFSALVAYTWSKVMQYNQSSALGGNTAYEYARAPFDMPHNVAISGSYQLPFGRNRKYLNNTNGFVDAIVGAGRRRRSSLFAAERRLRRSSRLIVPTLVLARSVPISTPQAGNPTFQRTLANWFDRVCYVVAPIYHLWTSTGQYAAFRYIQPVRRLGLQKLRPAGREHALLPR